MDNHQQSVNFNSNFAQHAPYDSNVTGLPVVSAQNSHGIPGSEYDDPDDTGLPLVAAQISPQTAVQQSEYDPNATSWPMVAAPISPQIAVDNYQADSTDVATLIDQIMGRAPPSISFSDNSTFQGDAFMNVATPPLFMPPEPNTSFMDNMTQRNADFQTCLGNQTQTVPLYDVQAQATANGISRPGQSAFFSSNYFFPENNMMQQPSMFASKPTWQGSVPGNLLDQFSAPPAMFNPQAYNSFLPDASTAPIRPQQQSPDSQLLGVNPAMPHTSLPIMSQFNSPNTNPMMSNASLPMMSQFNSLSTDTMMPQASLPGGVAFNPVDMSPMMPGTYTLPVSATDVRPVPPFGSPGRRVTLSPGMAARIQMGHNAFTSNAALSSPSGSSSSGTSMGGNSRDKKKRTSGASSAIAGREIARQDDSGTRASTASSQQGSRSSMEMYQQMIYDEPIINRAYDPRYAELGLPVDPFLRMFNQKPEFWKKVDGNADLSKP